MSIVAWNVRGIGNVNTTRALKDVLVKFNPYIVFLSETKKKAKFLDRLKSKNKFTGSFYVEPRGLAGGLALWWKENVSISIIKESVNFIDTLVSFNDEEPWQCTFIYGPPHSLDKRQFWETFQQIRHRSFGKWCIIGDVNLVAVQDKIGGAPVNKKQAQCFLDFMNNSGLIELPIKGGLFTWSNRRKDDDEITERIDKILVSSEWSLAYPKAIGILEAAVASDHNPILLQIEGLKKKRRKAFKFESRWLLEEECHSNVREEWERRQNCPGHLKLNRKLISTKDKLKRWSGKNRPEQCQTFRVADLIDVSNRRWREDILLSLFSHEEVSAIVTIPIGGPRVQDELVWANTKNGIYSVRSGYHLAYENNRIFSSACSSADPSIDKDFWKSIWSLKVPSKIRSFIWRACHNILPSNGNLCRRFNGLFGGGPTCPRCGEGFENVEHTLFFCPFASTVWKCSGFGYEPERIGFPGFGKWWKKLSVLNSKGLFADGLNLIAFFVGIFGSRGTLLCSRQLWNRQLKFGTELSVLLKNSHQS
ncbi:hypothetical protein GQ457_03G015870 [Hibiscus cannabinus]